MHHKGTRHGVPYLSRDLVADTAPLVQRNAIVGAPLACPDMQLLLLRSCCGDHVVDEDGVAIGLGDALDTKLLFHLPEIDIRIARKVVGDHEVRLGHNLVPGLDRRLARHSRQDLFGDRVAHV